MSNQSHRRCRETSQERACDRREVGAHFTHAGGAETVYKVQATLKSYFDTIHS